MIGFHSYLFHSTIVFPLLLTRPAIEHMNALIVFVRMRFAIVEVYTRQTKIPLDSMLIYMFLDVVVFHKFHFQYLMLLYR